MEIAPRLLSLAASLALVFATPYVVNAQSTPAAQGTAPPAAPAAAPPPATPGAPASQAGSPAAPTGAAPAGPQLEPQGYTYTPDGRRDPFISLLRRGGDTGKPTVGGGSRPAGLPGLETSEITLKGTIASQGSFVGILQGADNKTYIVKPGDHLLDGTIRTVTQNSVVITQQVTDPLSLEKQREVRKVLRQTEEAK